MKSKSIAALKSANAKSAAKPASRKVKTRDAILQSSLDLFNTEGFENTSIAMICDRINIMVGNLTYYFPKKREIVVAIAKQFEAELMALHSGLLAELLAGQSKVTPTVTHNLLRQMLVSLWRHRFFFASMISLEKLDKSILQTCRHLDQQARVGLSQLIQKTVDDDVIAPLVYPNSPSMLADNMWYLMWSSMFFQKASDSDLSLNEDLVVNNCLLHLGAVFEPLVEPSFTSEYCRLIAERR